MRTYWKMLMASILLGLAAVSAQARSWQSGPLSVEVLSDHSTPFEQFPAAGSAGDTYRAYLKAERGAAYRIRVRNRSGERVGLVIAVDGRNIVSGERSDLKRNEAMYILEPWSDAEYAGWRSNLSSINEFYFTDWRDSYAEAIGARDVFIGANAIDYSGYPDCRPDFIKSYQAMLAKGLKTGVEKKTVRLNTPLIHLTKTQIVKLAIKLRVPVTLTWSCYGGGARPCGVCDSCRFRAKGFKEAGIKDL